MSDSPEPDIEAIYGNNPTDYAKTEIPDNDNQDRLIAISKTDPNIFTSSIIKIINDNPDQFNVIQLSDTTMTKDSFQTEFEGTFKSELLEIIFDSIDTEQKGQISNAALVGFLSNKTKHPQREATTIDPKWLFKTIKSLNFGVLDVNNDREVSFDEMRDYFKEIKDKSVSDEIVQIVFNEIDANHKGYISMKDFFQWREKFDKKRLKTWSHTLSATVVMTGLEDLLEEISDDFELVENENENESKEQKTDEGSLLNKIKELQSTLSQERLDRQKEKQISDDEIARLEYKLGDAKYAMTKFKKELREIISDSSIQSGNTDITDLLGKLQYQLAEERMDKIKTRNLSMQLNDQINKINYELADERIQLAELKDILQEVVDLDRESITADNIDSIRDLLLELKERVEADTESQTGSDNEMKIDSNIDMEKELKEMHMDDSHDGLDYNRVTDCEQLRKIIKSLRNELRYSRTNHLAVSETKTHLEVQTFDLQSKLHSEKKKYTKLLRMSQQISGFDPKILEIEPESTEYTPQQLDDEINRLQAQLQSSREKIENVTSENAALANRIETLTANNRNHRHRESEVFTAIGDDAKNVIQQFEELEENRKQIENDALQLAYLQAEQRRMQIAYEHAKANASKYRLEATNLKSKLKDAQNNSQNAGNIEQMKEKLVDLVRKLKETENSELELAFYKAEKQRMDIKFEFQENKAKQARELNKELQKAVKQEKDKIQRMSQQFSSSDIAAISAGATEEEKDTLKERVNKLKDQLTKEQKEKAELQQRLSNAESTHVNQLLAYVNTTATNNSASANANANANGDALPPPPPTSSNHETEEIFSENMKALKFKLAHAELQNAQLQRRVSIAGVEKEELSCLWESPRVTIQMVSEFIERLPLKHKEKIWARHATGQYIAKNKILHTLHSFVALCIKIKDRTAVAPSRHDIEKKLVTFADVIRQKTENANGMSLNEFNNELHYWILEPVSGLIMTTDEHKQWMEEIDELREELVRSQKEKLRIQRKSQMDLTVLLDKMKEIETEPSDTLYDLNEQVEDLQGVVDELQDDLKEKEEIIHIHERSIQALEEENFNLRQTKDKSRESEDDNEESESESEENVPQLIDASQQKTLSEFREFQKEDRFEEERLEYSRNDSNVTKSQSYIGWKNKAENAKEEISRLERERKQSHEQVSQLTATVEQLQASKTAETSEYETQVQQFKGEIEKFKKKYQESDRIRKDSISTLHDNLFAKLLEAEAEHEEMVADYKQQIGRLQKINKTKETTINTMAKTKVDTIASLANTIQELRESVTALSKQIEMLKSLNGRLQSRTTVQHITSSFSGWLG